MLPTVYSEAESLRNHVLQYASIHALVPYLFAKYLANSVAMKFQVHINSQHTLVTRNS